MDRGCILITGSDKDGRLSGYEQRLLEAGVKVIRCRDVYEATVRLVGNNNPGALFIVGVERELYKSGGGFLRFVEANYDIPCCCIFKGVKRKDDGKVVFIKSVGEIENFLAESGVHTKASGLGDISRRDIISGDELDALLGVGK